jgi:hypothetical protein
MLLLIMIEKVAGSEGVIVTRYALRDLRCQPDIRKEIIIIIKLQLG